MRFLFMIVAFCLSSNAFAQGTSPRIGNKPLVQVKPKEPLGCKLVGTVKGTKLWAGNCTSSDADSALPEADKNQ